jgi:hypothetical protein
VIIIEIGTGRVKLPQELITIIIEAQVIGSHGHEAKGIDKLK